MARKSAEPAELSDLYRAAWDSSTALWPIFLIRLVFLVLNFFMIGLGLFIGFWPLIKALFGHWDEISGGNAKAFLQSFDWMTYFTNWTSLGLMALVVAFYITFACFFMAFFDGALYSQMNRYLKEGEGFSLKQFFSDGARYTFPMMGLISAWFLVFIGLMVAMGLVVALCVLVFNFLPWWIGVFLALPGALVFGGLLLWMLIAGMLGGAYLVDGRGIWDSIGDSLAQVWNNKGRTIGAVFLIMAVWIIFYVAFNTVFLGLSLIPFIGFLFTMVKVCVNSVLTIGFNIYLTALAVVLQLEAKEAR